MSSHPALTPSLVAVITGAAGGIGLATAERLARPGMKMPRRVNAAALEAARGP
jgi:NAD(P)-dependent dehydrogenase (short-subunit alcohol dehydrogenase family)